MVCLLAMQFFPFPFFFSFLFAEKSVAYEESPLVLPSTPFPLLFLSPFFWDSVRIEGRPSSGRPSLLFFSGETGAVAVIPRGFILCCTSVRISFFPSSPFFSFLQWGYNTEKRERYFALFFSSSFFPHMEKGVDASFFPGLSWRTRPSSALPFFSSQVCIPFLPSPNHLDQMLMEIAKG